MSEEKATKTVAQLLVELKLLGKRIEKALQEGVYIGCRVGEKVPTGYATIEEFEKKVISDYQAVTDLIAYRNRVKSAIVLSNAVTKVTVGKEIMTVAEAIERKSSIVHDKTLLTTLQLHMIKAINAVDAGNRSVNERLDKLIEITLGKDAKNIAAEATEVGKDFLNREQFALIDPLAIRLKAESLAAAIENFEVNIDMALSVSNATTQVEL